MERPELEQWLEKADKVLLEEEIALEGLKDALSGMSDEQIDAELWKNRTCPDIAGRDL